MKERVIAREPFEVACPDGWRLRGDWLLPPAPRGVAVVGHAMMVDRRTLDRPPGGGLVSTLAEADIAVAWADLRGHGRSGPRASEGGRWSYDDLVEGDAPTLLALARARFPSLPLTAIGHSLFGHVTLAHLLRHPDAPVDRLVMLACNIHNPTWRAHPLKLVEKGAYIELMHAIARAVGYFPARRLKAGSDDEALPYIESFVRGWRRCAWRAQDGFDWFAALPSVRVPVHAFVGAGDRLLSPPADVRALMARVPGATVEVVGRASGLPFDPGHMDLVLDERMRPLWQRVSDLALTAR